MLDDDVVRDLWIPPLAIERVAERETCELARRERVYRHRPRMTDVTGKVVSDAPGDRAGVVRLP